LKTPKEGTREYAPGIDQALRRATRQAELTAAATGTRLVIYEEGRITRVRPTPKMSPGKDLRDMLAQLPGHPKGFSRLKSKELPPTQKSPEVRRAQGKHTAVAEERAKYRSR
jgi:hypothetical protein